MGFGFRRPVGAGADVAELEYISALIQTDAQFIRPDGHLTAGDVCLYLNSRHGIEISPEQVRMRIMPTFGTDDIIDLIQLTTILLIPKLRKEASQNTSDLISRVWSNLVHDMSEDGVGTQVAQSRLLPSPKLTMRFLKRVLTALGERKLAERDDLLEEMVKCVGRNSDGTPPSMDVRDFTRALTHDITNHSKQDDPLGEPGLVRHVSLARSLRSIKTDDESRADIGVNHEDIAGVRVMFTAPYLDLAADTYRSRVLLVLAWCSFLMSFFTYYLFVGTFDPALCESFEYHSTWREGYKTFLCRIGFSVIRWFYVLVVMSVYGLGYFTLAGIGNGADTKRIALPLIAALGIAIFTVLPAIFIRRENRPLDVFLKITSSILGLAIILMNIWTALSLAFPHRGKWYSKWLTPAMIRKDGFTKQAAANKIDRMIQNSLSMHENKDQKSAIQSHLGNALLNYAHIGHGKFAHAGGFQWAWSKFWRMELAREEGIWFSGRLVTIGVTQFLTAIVVGIAGSILTGIVVRRYSAPTVGVRSLLRHFFNIEIDKTLATKIVDVVGDAIGDFLANQTACEGFASLEGARANATSLCELFADTTSNATEAEILRNAGFDVEQITNVSVSALVDAAVSEVNSLYPDSRYMVSFPMCLATITAFLTAVYVSSTLLPSMTTTILKFRCGLIPLMHNHKQKALRIAPDQTAFLQGSMFWGILFSSCLMGLLVGGIAFLFCWQVSSTVAQQATATMIGVIVVVLIHWLSVRSLRAATSKAYYRAHPLPANIVLLARECAFFALSVGFTIVRVAKLIFTTFMFVGRVDIPFLADGVGEIESLGFRLDNHPYVLQMDMLQHEAHRHPWIETFGVMCLSKLSKGNDFCTDAGATWRLIFVLVLMPWLSKYRTMARPKMRDGDDDWDFNASRSSNAPGGGKENHTVSNYGRMGGPSLFSAYGIHVQDRAMEHDDVDDLRLENSRLREELANMKRLMNRANPPPSPRLPGSRSESLGLGPNLSSSIGSSRGEDQLGEESESHRSGGSQARTRRKKARDDLVRLEMGERVNYKPPPNFTQN